MMFLSRLLLSGGRRKRLAREILNAATAQARNPEWYGKDRIHNSLDGRFEVLLLHVIPLLRRLRQVESGEGRKLADALHKTFFSDLEYGLREHGAGDFTIAKKIRVRAEAYLGRARAYDEALSSGTAAVTSALERNLADVVSRDYSFNMLAHYLVEAASRFDQTDDEQMMAGEFEWPYPAEFSGQIN